MKIFDCFQFFDENMMLDLRLNILNEYVHKFVIVENSYMHSGKKKEPVFNINNFSKFKDKIIYILVDKLPKGMYDINKISEEEMGNRIIDNTLLVEHAQRNSITKGLADAAEDDLIIISSLSSRAMGNKAFAVFFAIAFCSSEVPSMSSGCVAFPPIATIMRRGIPSILITT